MSRYIALKAAGLLFEDSYTDSVDESEIEEDPGFPLPHADDNTQDEEDLQDQALPLSQIPSFNGIIIITSHHLHTAHNTKKH